MSLAYGTAGPGDQFTERKQQALTYLQRTWGNFERGNTVIWHQAPNGPIRTEWFDPSRAEELERAAHYAASRPDNETVYDGLASRHAKLPGAQHGGLADCDMTNVLFIDADIGEAGHAEKIVRPSTEEAVLDVLGVPYPGAPPAGASRIPVMPTMVVRSGGGIHAYFQLAEPVSAMEAAVLNRRLEYTISRFAKCDGWEMSALGKANQLMRVPGSVNAKAGREPKPVELIHVDDREFGVDDFDWLVDEPDDEQHHFNIPNVPDGRNLPGDQLCKSLTAFYLLLEYHGWSLYRPQRGYELWTHPHGATNPYGGSMRIDTETGRIWFTCFTDKSPVFEEWDPMDMLGLFGRTFFIEAAQAAKDDGKDKPITYLAAQAAGIVFNMIDLVIPEDPGRQLDVLRALINDAATGELQHLVSDGQIAQARARIRYRALAGLEQPQPANMPPPVFTVTSNTEDNTDGGPGDDSETDEGERPPLKAVPDVDDDTPSLWIEPDDVLRALTFSMQRVVGPTTDYVWMSADGGVEAAATAYSKSGLVVLHQPVLTLRPAAVTATPLNWQQTIVSLLPDGEACVAALTSSSDGVGDNWPLSWKRLRAVLQGTDVAPVFRFEGVRLVYESKALDPEEKVPLLERTTLPDLGGATMSEHEDAMANDPPRMSVVEGLIVEGQHGVLSGSAKAGKSTTVADMAICVAGGTRFLGVRKTAKQGPVIVFSGEGGVKPFLKRLHAVGAARGLTPAQVSALPIYICAKVPIISLDHGLAAFAEEIWRVQERFGAPPALVVLDPMYLAVGGDADGSNLYSMGALLDRARAIVALFAGTALMVVHHHNRDRARSGIERLSGAGPAEWARFVITIDADPDRDRTPDEKPGDTQPSSRLTDVTLIIGQDGGENGTGRFAIRRKIWVDNPVDAAKSPDLAVLRYSTEQVPVAATEDPYGVVAKATGKGKGRGGGSVKIDPSERNARMLATMQRVYDDLVQAVAQGEPAKTTRAIRTDVVGGAEAVTEALNRLATMGHISRRNGPKGGHLWSPNQSNRFMADTIDPSELDW